MNDLSTNITHLTGEMQFLLIPTEQATDVNVALVSLDSKEIKQSTNEIRNEAIKIP